MLPGASVRVLDPVQAWLEEAGLDTPVPALEILELVVAHLRKHLLGAQVREDRMLLEVRHSLSRALRVQAEMRAFAQDFEKIDSFAQEVSVDFDGAGSFTVFVPPGWADRLDKVLHTRTCSRCGVVVPGVPHGPRDCDRELARDVMES